MTEEIVAAIEAPVVDAPVADATDAPAPDSGSAPDVDKTDDTSALTDKAQARFDKLTRDKYDALRRADQLEYRLQELEQRLQAPKELVAPAKVPTLESLGYDEGKYQSALIEFARSEARAAALAEFENQTKAAQAKARAGEWDRRQAEFAKSMPDYAEKVNASLPISQAMAEVIRESEMGPEVAYFLGNNPDKAQALASLPAAQAAREIGRIEARLEIEKANKLKPAAPVSQAPPPPPKVDASEASAKIDLGSEDADKLSDAEWARRRTLQEQRKRENRNRA